MSTTGLKDDGRDERGEIPLIQVFREEDIKGDIKPERMIAVELSLAGTDPEAPV